jgi:hypothetical protein
MVTEERRTCVEQFLARVCAWSLQRPDVVAVALVGSWGCSQPGMDSDVDLVVLTTDKPAYLHEESWGQSSAAPSSSVHDFLPAFARNRSRGAAVCYASPFKRSSGYFVPRHSIPPLARALYADLNIA